MRNSWVGLGCLIRRFCNRHAGVGGFGGFLAYPEDEIEEHQQSLHAGHRGHGLQSLAHLKLRCLPFFWLACDKTLLDTAVWVITHYQVSLGQRAEFARSISREDLRIHLHVACVAPAPLLNWCMRATPRGYDSNGGNSPYQNLFSRTGASSIADEC